MRLGSIINQASSGFISSDYVSSYGARAREERIEDGV